MSFQRFQKATSANIVYTGPNQALGPDSITNASNYNKFAKNVGGNVNWVTLPLPDVTNFNNFYYRFTIFNSKCRCYWFYI